MLVCSSILCEQQLVQTFVAAVAAGALEAAREQADKEQAARARHEDVSRARCNLDCQYNKWYHTAVCFGL